jgi:HEAT repeat protein
MLTGQLPFQGPTAAVVGQILTQAPARPTSLRPDLDAPLEAICLKAMAKEVKDRFASMGDFATALARYLKGEISKKQTQETIPLGQGKPQAIPVPPATVGADQGEGEELATQLLTSLTDRLGAGAVPARPSRVGGKSGHQMQFWPLLMAVLFTVAGLVALAVFYRGPTENVSKEDKSDNPFKESLAPPTGERQQGSGREGSLREEKKEEPEVKPSAAVKPLIERLNDENAGVRRQVAESLEKLGDKSAVPALVRRVADDLWDSSDSYSKSSSSKKAALSALTVLGPERVTEALLKAAASATIPVRVFACEELGKQKDSESAAGLVAALKDPSEKVRRATAAALANVRPPVVLALAQALFDEDVTVRRQAAESLEILGNKSKLPASTVKQVAAEAVPALVRRVADDLWYPSDSYSKSRSSKRAALSALKMLGPEKISEALLGALHSKNEPVRIWACEELANQKDKESIAGLTAALSKDPSERVRAAAAAALSNNPTRGQTP